VAVDAGRFRHGRGGDASSSHQHHFRLIFPDYRLNAVALFGAAAFLFGRSGVTTKDPYASRCQA